jgi:hypothetical protein
MRAEPSQGAQTDRADYIGQCETCEALIFRRDEGYGYDLETNTYACPTCTASYMEGEEHEQAFREGAQA